MLILVVVCYLLALLVSCVTGSITCLAVATVVLFGILACVATTRRAEPGQEALENEAEPFGVGGHDVV